MEKVKVCKFCKTEILKSAYKEHKATCVHNPKNKRCASCMNGLTYPTCIRCKLTGKIVSKKATCTEYTKRK